jgi:DNA-binding NtrC family response regulator
MAIRSAAPDVTTLSADDPKQLDRALAEGVDLVLLNRELGYAFDDAAGVDLIRTLHTRHPQLKLVLVSNYPAAQSAAQSAGALPGFGKRDLGSPRVLQLLKAALAPTHPDEKSPRPSART